jgi:uncharacterized protein (TIGR00255 family)
MQTTASRGGVHSIKSMTGFGRGRRTANGVEVVTEVRSVNHRFLDISVRVPRIYSSFDPQIRQILSARIHRGKLEVAVSRTGSTGTIADVGLDLDLAHRYYSRLKELRERLGLAGEISVSDMLTLKEIMWPVEKEEIEQEQALVEESLDEALVALDHMRSTEGATIWKDIETRLKAISEMVALISPLVGEVTASVKDRLERRVKELTGGMELNEDRLLQEVALLADRADVTEELTRLKSHVGQFLAFGQEGSPQGRKLDFLLQELHREVNTLGSKSSSTDIASYVVLMKTEIERIREQTQNLE